VQTLFIFQRKFDIENQSLKSPPTPPLEKGGEGGISGIARLKKTTIWAGVPLSYFAIFQFLIFFFWKSSGFIRVHLRPI